MRNRWFATFVLTGCSLVSSSNSALAAGAFYGDPPDDLHPWAVHDMNRPKPITVTPGTFSTQQTPGQPPSDAIILFDGKTLDNWTSSKEPGGPAKWPIRDNYMEATSGAGDIQTKQHFGDCQLHVEWATPTQITQDSQNRGNSGIFLMGLCEIQVLDNYINPTYSDGYASSVYGVNPPMANPLRPPGEYQFYDIVFRRPLYKNGKQLDPGYVTVFVNGVLTQDHTPLEGPTGHMKRTFPSPYPEKGPIKLQDHRNPVHFRNIWVRSLPPRAIEGGTDGILTPEATIAKRVQTAATIRADAENMGKDTVQQMLRLAESLCYEKNDQTVERVESWMQNYAEKVRSTPAAQLAPRKDEIKQVHQALSYLAKFNILPAAAQPANQLDTLIKANKWDK